jgi:Glycosyltransferase family 87
VARLELSLRSYSTTGRRCGEWAALVAVPAVVAAVCCVSFVRRGVSQPDFGAFWLAARAVLHGHSPYASLASLPPGPSRGYEPYGYPPLTAFLLAPLAALPFLAAKLAFLAVNVGALVLALRLLGVRDWRCYSVAFVSAPVVESLATGTLSILLLLGVAAAWRYRERAAVVGMLVAAVASAKLFLWPLWFWLVRQRRRRGAVVAVGASLASVIGLWAVIGFAGLHDYPQRLDRLTRLYGPHSYSTYALARVLGVGPGRAVEVTYLIGAIALALAFFLVADDRRSLVAVLGVSFLATPIFWPHYLALLFVPVALASPKLTRVWVIPLLLWANPTAWSTGHAWPVAGELVLALLGLGVVLRIPPMRLSRVAAV